MTTNSIGVAPRTALCSYSLLASTVDFIRVLYLTGTAAAGCIRQTGQLLLRFLHLGRILHQQRIQVVVLGGELALHVRHLCFEVADLAGEILIALRQTVNVGCNRSR